MATKVAVTGAAGQIGYALLFRIASGQLLGPDTKVHLNLHLFNASDNALSGESGIWIKSQATPTPTLAEMVFSGKFLFQVPKIVE